MSGRSARTEALTIVIPTHNSLLWIDDCLASVEQQEWNKSEVVVVDNASRDGTPERVRDRWPDVRLVLLSENRGYGAAVNRGAVGGSGHVLALNVDTRLRPDCLGVLMASLTADPSVGLVAPRLVDLDGGHQPNAHDFPTLAKLLSEAVAVDRIPPLSSLVDYHRRGYSYCEKADVGWATGAALLIRREAWDAVAGFDPAYFFFVEDVDLQKRLAAAGWRRVIEPAAVVAHGGSRGPWPAEHFSQAHDGYERYFALHHSRPSAVLARTILCLTAVTRAAGWSLVAMHPGKSGSPAASWARMFWSTARKSLWKLPDALGRSYVVYPGAAPTRAGPKRRHTNVP